MRLLQPELFGQDAEMYELDMMSFGYISYHHVKI